MLMRKLKRGFFLKFVNFMMNFAPGATHMLFAGEGSSRQLCRHIGHSGLRKILVVTDKPLRDLGVVDRAIAGLGESGVDCVIYDGVLPDPTYAIVEEGKAVYEREACDGILAIGGGSSIDAAKVMGVALAHTEDPQSLAGFGLVKEVLPPLYAIPTTSGTGSEATMGAVISDNETHEKGILSGATMLPRAACLDSDLMMGLPPHITAATGMDALTHAVEAYIGVWDRGDANECATMAVRLVFENLPKACADGSDRAARESMAYAAYLAGQAINQVNVGNVHAIAHQLGAFYGIPHGLANALVMPHVLDYSLEAARDRLTDLARIIGKNTAEEFVAAVREMNQTVGIGARAENLNPADFPAIVERALAEGDGYASPHMMVESEIMELLEKLQ